MTQITELALSNFRNYPSLQTEFLPGLNIITGHNGMGKTNLLEAISFLTPQRGLRGAKLEEVALAGENNWAVVAEIDGYKIATGLEPGFKRRVVKIDDEKQNGANMLAEYLPCIWLTPQMDNIFLEARSERRQFFDRLIYNFDPEHSSRVAVYENAMRERLRLLKDGHSDEVWLSTLEKRMAEYGTAIAHARLEVIGYLNQALAKSATSFPTPLIEVAGKYEEMLANGEKALAVEDELLADLGASRGEDARIGRSSVGANKTDFIVTHKAKNMVANLCSTGEQKALLISIILGLAALIKQRKNKMPVILLDEVVAHLDETRRVELLEEITALGCQAFLTGTDRELFGEVEANFIEIEDGKVK